MCGIVGYTGRNQVAPILLDGLLKLEPEHISCYSLILEENTPLFEEKDFFIHSLL